MSKQLVVAQVGCGGFAVDQHGPNIVRNPHTTRIKWACDISDAAARKYAAEFGAENVSTSIEQATTDPEVDIVCIATSHEAHVPIIESAARNGKHVFCEKPMAFDEEQAIRIMRAVRRGNIKLCVDYNRRMAPASIALKRQWQAHRDHVTHQPWRVATRQREQLPEEKVSDFFVRVQDESSSYRMVHLDPTHGGGLVIGEGVHWLDLACWLFDEDVPVEMMAWGSSRMRYGMHLAFRSGNAATISMTPNGTFDYPKEQFEIACDGALFRMEHWVENQYFGRPGIERETFPLQRDPLPDVGQQGGLAGYMEKYSRWMRGAADPLGNYLKIWPNHGWEEMFNGFVESVVNDRRTPCNELDGYRATLLGRLAVTSIELNQPLPIPVENWNVHLEV